MKTLASGSSPTANGNSSGNGTSGGNVIGKTPGVPQVRKHIGM